MRPLRLPTNGTSTSRPIWATPSKRWKASLICSATRPLRTTWAIRIVVWRNSFRTCKQCAQWLPMDHCEYIVDSYNVYIYIYNVKKKQEIVLLPPPELSKLQIPTARSFERITRTCFPESGTTSWFLQHSVSLYSQDKFSARKLAWNCTQFKLKK